MKLKSKILAITFIILFCLQTVSFADNVPTSAEASILVELRTGRIISERNSTKQLYPASTTKIMTAILVIENCNLDDIVTVSGSAISNIPTGYVTANLQAGEELTVKDLLYALMLPSANDAAYVLAEHVAGSLDSFSDMMNAKAKELGCTGTHFVNPNGIHAENHYSTAYDLYLIANYCMKNETFRTIVSTKEYTLPATNKYENADRAFTTTNELIDPDKEHYYKYATGIKTGFTSLAGNCLVSSSSRDGLEFIAVVLNSENNRFADCTKLFNYAYDNYTLTKVKEKNTVIETIEVENGTKETKTLDLLIDDSITVVNNRAITSDQIIPEITLKEDISAPITAGQVLGKIKYKVDDIEYSANLIAKTDVVEKIDISIYLVIAGIIILLFASLILKNKKKSRKKRKRK